MITNFGLKKSLYINFCSLFSRRERKEVQLNHDLDKFSQVKISHQKGEVFHLIAHSYNTIG